MKRPPLSRVLLLSLTISAFVLPSSHGQGGYDTPRRTDTFNAGSDVSRTRARRVASKPSAPTRSTQRGPTTRLKRGQIVQVLQSSRFARPELAFYLPPEATSVVQVVVEQKGTQVNYFLKALSPGKTVGGAVERQWLDARGFRPRNLADEARIQAAVQRDPLFIEVQ